MMHAFHSLAMVLLISTARMIYCLRGNRALYNCNHRFSRCHPPIRRCYPSSTHNARNVGFSREASPSSLNFRKKRWTWEVVRNNLGWVPLILSYRSRRTDMKRDILDNGHGMLCTAHAKSNENMEEKVIPNGMLLERNGPPSHNKLLWDEHRGVFYRIDKQMGNYWWLNPVALISYLVPFIHHTFIPENVTADYASFTKWRCTQRFLSSTVNVFGTKALLIAIGINSNNIGVIATTSWVIKDALGKLGRILWAGRMGQRFDADAKRWRFRSSLLYGIGSGLEIATYIVPSFFLLLATCGNTLKQASMVTSSATRNTIYRSFALGENIGDITAKGEAQIAVVDMLGILSGILLSNIVGSNLLSIGFIYVLLTVLDIFAIYREIRSVVFTMLNYERASIVIDDFVLADGMLPSLKSSPSKVAMREHVFLPSRSIPNVFRTVTGAGLSTMQLTSLAEIFKGEGFLVASTPEKGYSIILHMKAEPTDVIKALLCFRYMRDRCGSESDWDTTLEAAQISRNLMNRTIQSFLNEIDARGWSRNKFMFGDIKRRSDWSQVITFSSS